MNKPKYVYNFFLTKEEKELIFAIKHIHRLNNRLGNDNESYSSFIQKMTDYYSQILKENNYSNFYADKNKNSKKSQDL